MLEGQKSSTSLNKGQVSKSFSACDTFSAALWIKAFHAFLILFSKPSLSLLEKHMLVGDYNDENIVLSTLDSSGAKEKYCFKMAWNEKWSHVGEAGGAARG